MKKRNTIKNERFNYCKFHNDLVRKDIKNVQRVKNSFVNKIPYYLEKIKEQHYVTFIFFQAIRRLATKAAEVPKGYTEIKKVQEQFQKKDGKPIFLKGGVFDQVLYRVTMGLSVVGIAGIGKLIYDLSFPKPE